MLSSALILSSCGSWSNLAKGTTIGAAGGAVAVSGYLLSKGVPESQIKSVEGFGSKQPVADNSTAAGRAENRRVEIYLYASAEMIDAANNGTLK